MNYYTINEVSEFTFVTVYTLSYYDQIGLLKPGHITSNGHRFYTDSDIMRLQQVIALQHTGLSLGQVRVMLASDEFSEQQHAENITYIFGNLQEFENQFNLSTDIESEQGSYPNSDELTAYIKASKKNTKSYWFDYMKRWEKIFSEINDYLQNNSGSHSELKASPDCQNLMKEIAKDLKPNSQERLYAKMIEAIKKCKEPKNHQ